MKGRGFEKGCNVNVCKLEAAEAFAGGGRNGNQDLNCQDVAMFNFLIPSLYSSGFVKHFYCPHHNHLDPLTMWIFA